MALKDICVIGLGRFGEAVVTQLARMNRHVFAIDTDEDEVRKMSNIATTVAIADGSDINALNGLGIQGFTTVIVAMADNINVVASLAEIGITNIIAKATSERHARVLRQIGVTNIVFPEAEAGMRTALLATNVAFLKYSKKIEEIGDGFGMATVTFKNANWAGKPLMNLNFKKLGVNVVTINRKSRVILPEGKIELEVGDNITLIGKLANLAKAMVFLSHDSEDPEQTLMLNVASLPTL